MALVFSVMHLYENQFCPFFLVLVNQMEEFMILVCPSLLCFFNKGDIRWTNSSKKLCLMFLYVLLYINLCQD